MFVRRKAATLQPMVYRYTETLGRGESAAGGRDAIERVDEFRLVLPRLAEDAALVWREAKQAECPCHTVAG